MIFDATSRKSRFAGALAGGGEEREVPDWGGMDWAVDSRWELLAESGFAISTSAMKTAPYKNTMNE